jgi:peptide-methionine (S)-S-oxide reductase
VSPRRTEKATFGAGCFWCVEAVFGRMDGVLSVEAGYSGGEKANPTYEDVCTGTTGHAEVVQVEFDPDKVTYGQLLDTFWKAHDPTTLNRQGGDVGTQYRSVIFYHDDEQKKLALASRATAQVKFSEPIVTDLHPAQSFFKAEAYHQDYFRNNPDAPYCRFVIQPKLQKLKIGQNQSSSITE